MKLRDSRLRLPITGRLGFAQSTTIQDNAAGYYPTISSKTYPLRLAQNGQRCAYLIFVSLVVQLAGIRVWSVMSVLVASITSMRSILVSQRRLLTLRGDFHGFSWLFTNNSLQAQYPIHRMTLFRAEPNLNYRRSPNYRSLWH